MAADSGALRVIHVAPGDPAAHKTIDGDASQVVGEAPRRVGNRLLSPKGTHLGYCEINAPGAGGVGISELNGSFYPIESPKSAELFYVMEGSSTVLRANGQEIPVKKGDLVFVPRGVAYGGLNFNHYRHAFILIDAGTGPLPGGPTEVTVLHPESLGKADFHVSDGRMQHDYYTGADRSRVVVWQLATGSGAHPAGTKTSSEPEFSIVLSGSIILTSAARTWTARAGDVYFIPRGATVAYRASKDFREVTVTAPVE